MRRKKPKLISDERGVSVAEYAVMLVLVALALALYGPGVRDALLGAFQAFIDAIG